jgi:hypothetical protein
MEGQFKQLPCLNHGNRCPDYVIQQSDVSGWWYLTAENASYGLEFCPWCGTKIPYERLVNPENKPLDELFPEQFS